jgi:methoxymalonate biosynthesis acyl carrier protein
MSVAAQVQIRDFIASRFPAAAELGDTENIFSLGFVNSLFAIELVMFIEKAFDLTIPSDELRIDNFRTLDSMSQLIERQTAVVGAARGAV